MGPSHRLAGAAAWLAVAPVLPVSGWQVAAGAIVAGATANGRLSPDADSPVFWSGRHLFTRHRGVLHWWPVPLLMFGAGLAAAVGSDQGWLLLAVAVAWGSHIAADAVCGLVPVWPRRNGGWERAGMGLRTGGMAELWLFRPVFVAAVPALAFWDVWLMLGGVS